MNGLLEVNRFVDLMGFYSMQHSAKVVIRSDEGLVRYDGYGPQGRTYAIHKQGCRFAASLIAGDGQPITAVGRSPLEALRRAESVQLLA